ncbi:hypothetical protein LUZ61_008030 [Rhynchospora tenuis]|uniref:F-box domain-containing protein n=1 Tax=Rhynchospora tenuis TaxID=198213 RepID=A0AAD5ZUJ3_9POAL|nr:hypothetical protein LUZ61_008030 [Rhynchospora tenuis]
MVNLPAPAPAPIPTQRRRHAYSNEPDHLSALPDAVLVTILSLLPTRVAARTSVLCRRFRHLWRASPSIDLSLETPTFEATAHCALLSRPFPRPPPPHCHYVIGVSYIDSIIPPIFSIDTLHSLHILTIILKAFPSLITLTRSESLSLSFDSNNDDPAQLNHLLSHLSSLHHLLLFFNVKDGFTLSSQTLQNLDLFLIDDLPGDKSIGLSMPSLEMLKLNLRDPQGLLRIHVDAPSLKKATIKLHGLCKPDVTAVAHLLNSVSNVEELSLHIEESRRRSPYFLFCLSQTKMCQIFLI